MAKRKPPEKVDTVDLRILIQNAEEVWDSRVKNFTTSAYVPVPKNWRGCPVKVIRLKEE